MLVDPDGREVNIGGDAQQEYFNQIKIGAKAYGIKVKMDKNGTLSAKYTGKGPISEDGQKIMDAINDKTVHVEITANWRSESDLVFGGTFGGNNIIGGVTTNGEFSSTSTYAYQTVIVPDLTAMDNFYNKKGQTSLHEMTEAFFGAKLAEKNGISSLEKGKNNPYYIKAHEMAIPQSGKVDVFYYGRNNQPISGDTDFSNLKYIDWNVGHGTPDERNIKTSILK
jgi:hypothetical protein